MTAENGKHKAASELPEEENSKKQRIVESTEAEQDMEEPTKKIRDFLDRTELTQLFSARDPQHLIVLEHNWTVARALQELGRNKILSAPLIISPDLEDLSENDGVTPMGPSLLGYLDVNDILSALLRHLEDKGPIPHKMLQLMTELEKEGPVFTSKLLITLVGGQDKDLVYQANSNISLLDAIRDHFLAATVPKVVHRIAIFNAIGDITHIVSQLDILRFLQKHPEQLEGVAGQSLEALGLMNGKPPVESVSPHIPTLLAFQKMSAAGVSGAAVVPDSGELIANLSISDLRCIQPEHLSVLALPVAEFLAVQHRTVYAGYSAKTSGQACHPFFGDRVRSPSPLPEGNGTVPLITCKATSTFQEVLELLVKNKIHRLYVVDDQEPAHPIATITPTDILRYLSGVC